MFAKSEISGGRHTAARRQPLWRAPRARAYSRRMLAVARLAAHKLRAGWRGWAALALITAIWPGGAVLTAAAGATRTDTAYPRFLEQSSASDALVAPAGSGVGGFDAAVGRLPAWPRAPRWSGINAVPVSAAGVPDQDTETFASLDGRYGRTVDIPKLLAGRLPAQDAPREIAVDQIAAQQLNLHVGSIAAAWRPSTTRRTRALAR